VRGPVKLFGSDYDTPDGTCIRDYVHVEDLSDAHLRALDHLESAPGFHAFNLGAGTGSSVAEVLAACRAQFSGMPASTTASRRAGDPAILVANYAAATSVLRWQPLRTLADCVMTATAWHLAEAEAKIVEATRSEHS
jgi:UDP-glucose 4-epimerase